MKPYTLTEKPNPRRLAFLLVLGILFSATIWDGSSGLSAYTPGKWSHKDRYLFPTQPLEHSPKREEVFNSKNELLLVADFRFENGRLVEEVFTAGGKPEGKTSYTYDSEGRLTQETTRNAQGKPSESKEFTYGKSKKLSKIKIFDESGILTQETSVSTMDGEFIVSGEILWLESKDRELITTKSKPDSRVVSILDEKQKPIAKVEFKLDKQGRVVERNFTQGESQKRNQFEYDGQGRLIGFSFHVKQGGQWVLEKRHVLSY